ncbi:phosphatidate cytidylyltransferase [Caldalkalibacillus salinus]|uniref:phosphatidate cytidylyltransferase n=1 Tax=Caldalkalibacillus salinus TaxID=2803787 RepID=UPI0019239873|nr:phosphatidate cytidylyltransferase [Caldalkalibacillus salinus]
MKTRIVTGIIGGALFLGVLWYGGMIFSVLVTLLALLGWNEYAKMANIENDRFITVIGFFLTSLFFLPSVIPNISTLVEAGTYHQHVMIFIVVVLFTYVVFSKNKFTIEHAGVVILGLIYIGFGFFFFLHTRLTYGDYAFAFILYILIVIWSTDSGAYFVGKKYGKHKLWPEISPNKTIEGSAGAILVALITATIFHSLQPNVFQYNELVLYTLIISTVGQVGDLVQSAIKRHYSVKDSGTLLPGHGGVLDRFDSLLFVFPILYLLQLI